MQAPCTYQLDRGAFSGEGQTKRVYDSHVYLCYSEVRKVPFILFSPLYALVLEPEQAAPCRCGGQLAIRYCGVSRGDWVVG
jgi:hypothetical protein